MTEIKNFDGDISVGRHAVVGGDAKVCGGVTVGKNLKVEGWLDAKNLKAANKGVFLNEESLKKAYPVPKDGWWALVGDTLPAALWVAADGEWGNTGGTGGDILLESEVLADIKERLTRAQEGVDAATTKNAEQDNRLANAEVLSTKQNERLLNYVYQKLYQLNEGAGALPFDGMYSGSASVLSGRKTVAEDGYTYKVVFALHKFLLQEISPGGVTIGLYEEWDRIISGRGSSEDYAKRDRLYYVYTEGEGSYYYYVDADGNISEKSGTYVLRKLIDETKVSVSSNTEKLDVQERYIVALNAASSEHSQKIEAIEGRAGEIETKNSDQDKKIVSLINRLKKQEEVVVALAFHGFTDTAADSLMLFNPKDTYSYQVLFSTASNSFVLRVVDNANQVTKYIGTYSSWNAVDGVQASSYYERRDTLYKYLDLSYGAYRYYYYGEDGNFFEAPGTKYLSRIIEKQGGKIDENTQKVEELQAQVSSIEKVEDIQWGGGRHMNVFIEKGDFHIHGERTDVNDGLPILNAASGHTIDARLTVLDSSLTGGTGAKTDACVTQILRLSNRNGGDGHVYVRTAQAASKAELTATDNTRWGTWEKLMGMFEKNAVENATDLDTYTTNGMYSGVFMFSGYQQNWGVAITPGSTFLLVTVNGYAVAKAGLTPQLTQMLYLLPAKDFNAPAKMYLRTAYWNVSAKSWNYQNWDKIATANDLSPITEEAQSAKTLANNNAGRIYDIEGRVSVAEGRIAAIENIIPEEYGLSTIVELGSFKNFALLLSEAAKFERVSNIGISLMHGSYLNEGSLYNGAIIIQQTNADSCTSVQYIFLEGRRFTRFIRYSSTDVVEVQGVQNDGVRDIELKGGVLQLIDMWSNPIGVGATLPDDSNIYEGNATLSTVPIVMAKAQGGTVTATLMPATSARAGVMTAADKEKLDALSIGEGGGTVDNALLTEVQEKAQSALNTAIAAKTTAQGAQTTADNANTAAQEAKATADGIAAKANSASVAAAEAKQTAGAAKSAADAAQTTANSAQTAAQEAKATATAANSTANAAKETADAAQESANTAQQTADAAQTKNADQDTRIAALLQDIPWEGYHMNAFTDTGEYHIHGESTDANDGLPILNSGTIDARLTVLDSSLTNGTGAKTDIVVTQILRLSNRMGGDGHVYVRTGHAATKSQLATPSSTAWGTWEKLMGMFEKNAVTNIADLDTYTTNGMYSGLFANTAFQTLGGLKFTPGDTFLLITVNGYAASAFGTPQLTQMLYKLPSKQGSGESSASMYMRTAYWNVNVTPKRWEFANWDRLAMASEISGGGGGSIHKLLVSITWSELKSLRDNSQLVAGTLYRITDYTCTTIQENTRSAGHIFDVIVRADSENKLNEEAFAIQHEGDDYFASSNLSAWKLWYSLDNDTTRFAWADAENGKGVIYRMIDEWNNDVPYDFKNINFKRYIIEADNAFATNVSKGGEIDVVKAMLKEMSHKIHTDLWYYGEYVSDVYPDANPEARYVPFGDVPKVICLIDENSYGWFYTFHNEDKDASLLKPNVNETIGVCDNTIKDSCYVFLVEEGAGSYYPTKINAQSLNNIVFLGNSCYSNSFGNNCYSNSLGNSCYSNSFGNDCNSNSFGNDCNSNSLGNSCYSNSFGNNCYSNSLGNSCYSNSFGNDCNSNSFGNDCNSNSLGNSCYSNSFGNKFYSNSFGNNFNSNSFGNNCYSNSFGNNCYSNSFGNNFNYNSFGNSCHSNSFGNNCYSNSFGNNCYSNSLGNDCNYISLGNSCNYNSFGNSCNYISLGNSCNYNSFGNSCNSIMFASDSSASTKYNYYQNNHFGDGCQYIVLKVAGDASNSKLLQNYNFAQGVQGTSSNYLNIDGVRNLSYETKVAKNSSGELKIYCEADLIQ